MQVVNPKIGNILGRNDLAQGRGGPVTADWSSGSIGNRDPVYGPTLGASAGAQGSFNLGQISALQLMILIGAWVGFYWWTHKHQG